MRKIETYNKINALKHFFAIKKCNNKTKMITIKDN